MKRGGAELNEARATCDLRGWENLGHWSFKLAIFPSSFLSAFAFFYPPIMDTANLSVHHSRPFSPPSERKAGDHNGYYMKLRSGTFYLPVSEKSNKGKAEERIKGSQIKKNTQTAKKDVNHSKGTGKRAKQVKKKPEEKAANRRTNKRKDNAADRRTKKLNERKRTTTDKCKQKTKTTRSAQAQVERESLLMYLQQAVVRSAPSNSRHPVRHLVQCFRASAASGFAPRRTCHFRSASRGI